MQNVKLLVGVVVGTVVLVLGVALLFSQESSPRSYDATLVMGERSHVKRGGSEVATEASESANLGEVKVSVVEFSDLQCSACRASQPMVEQVMASFGDRVELIFRHFPLPQIHQNAVAAAVAAEAAAEMGMFWEYHDKLFAAQDDWAEVSDPRDMFVEYASELGLLGEEFEKLLDSDQMVERVEKDVAAGNSLGINATPTFFVNGVKVGNGDLYGAVTRAMNE